MKSVCLVFATLFLKKRMVFAKLFPKKLMEQVVALIAFFVAIVAFSVGGSVKERLEVPVDTRVFVQRQTREVERSVADALKRVKPEKGEETPEIEIGWVQKLIDDTPSAAHAEYYLNIVRDQYLCRKGKRLAQGFAASLETGPALAIQKFQSGLVEIMAEATLYFSETVTYDGDEYPREARVALALATDW